MRCAQKFVRNHIIIQCYNSQRGFRPFAFGFNRSIVHWSIFPSRLVTGQPVVITRCRCQWRFVSKICPAPAELKPVIMPMVICWENDTRTDCHNSVMIPMGICWENNKKLFAQCPSDLTRWWCQWRFVGNNLLDSNYFFIFYHNSVIIPMEFKGKKTRW